MWDEDEPKPKLCRVNPIPPDPLGVAELQHYLDE